MNSPHFEQALGRLIARSGGRSKFLVGYTQELGFHLLWYDHLAATLFGLDHKQLGEFPWRWESLPAALQVYLAQALPETNGEAVQQLRPYFPSGDDRRHYQISLYHESDDDAPGGPAQYFLFCFEDVSEWIRESQESLDAHKLESIGELASGVAHDFNNLIMGIQSSAEALLTRVEGNEELQSLAINMVRACSHGTSLTRSLLGYAKRQPLSIHGFDLVAMVGDIVKIARLTLDRSGHRLMLGGELAVGADPIEVEGCYSSLSHCMLNLIKNAREAMPAGGDIHINSACDEQYSRLKVRDHGVGIPESELAHIFEPFYSTKKTGTGLGLSMVRGIMSQHSGFIEIASTLGEGTEITLVWPRHLLPESAAARKSTSDSSRFDPRRSTNSIVTAARVKPPSARMGVKPAPAQAGLPERAAWIIDDDELVRNGVVALLTHLKYQARGFACAEDALAAAADAGFPKLVLVDYNMPGLNGTQFIEIACRDHREWMKPNNTRILLVSGFPPHEFQSLIGAYGEMSVGMLQKPFSLETLRKKLANFEAPRSVTTHIRLPRTGSMPVNPKDAKPISAKPRVSSAATQPPPKIKPRVRPSGPAAPVMPKLRTRPDA